jgi:hypothetical protein
VSGHSLIEKLYGLTVINNSLRAAWAGAAKSRNYKSCDSDSVCVV